MNGRTDRPARSLVVLAVLVVAGFALIARLAWWQVVARDGLVAEARLQGAARVPTAAVRGTVYDRSGLTVLATTVHRDLLEAYPADLVAKDKDADKTASLRTMIADRIAGILGLDGEQAAAVRDKFLSGKEYVVIARDLTPTQSAAIRDAHLAGHISHVHLEPDYRRVYPAAGGDPRTTLAAHLLGFVNVEGKGQYGLEGRWQDVLAGTPRVTLVTGGSGRAALEYGEVIEEGEPGADLTLTIDASLQLKVEQEVHTAWVANRAKSVSAVVMDPRTGAILASATYPSYNANDYRAAHAKDPGVFVDQVVASFYEPGSVFKMLTAAAALRAGVVKRTTKIADQEVLVLDKGEARVRNADKRSRGTKTFQDHVAFSRNVVMSKVALRLGKSTRAAAKVLYDTWIDFGFGRPTGIDLAGEIGGQMRDPAVTSWAQIDLANGSFGQGVGVTLIQLATAYCAMVNGGTLPVPHVVAAVNGEKVDVPEPERIISAALSRDLVRIMKEVVSVVPLYRTGTRIKGYVVGGKTGTAQIWDAEKKAWRKDVFNFTFAGFIGRTSPDLVVVVRVEEGKPLVNRSGDIVNAVESFELFRRVATDAMATLDLLPLSRTVKSKSTSPASTDSKPASRPKDGQKATPTPRARSTPRPRPIATVRP